MYCKDGALRENNRGETSSLRLNHNRVHLTALHHIRPHSVLSFSSKFHLYFLIFTFSYCVKNVESSKKIDFEFFVELSFFGGTLNSISGFQILTIDNCCQTKMFMKRSYEVVSKFNVQLIYNELICNFYVANGRSNRFGNDLYGLTSGAGLHHILYKHLFIQDSRINCTTLMVTNVQLNPTSVSPPRYPPLIIYS